MNKFFKNLTKDQKFINLNLNKKLIYYDKEYNKFNIKEVNVKEYLREGKSLLLYPYPCKITIFIIKIS